jgi:hypothetical protein
MSGRWVQTAGEDCPDYSEPAIFTDINDVGGTTKNVLMFDVKNLYKTKAGDRNRRTEINVTLKGKRKTGKGKTVLTAFPLIINL